MHIFLIFFLFSVTKGKRLSFDLSTPTYKALNQNSNNGGHKSFQRGADFGHVYRKSVQNPNDNRPYDLDKDMIQPDLSNARQVYQDFKKNEMNLNGQPLLFLSPRDELLYHKTYNVTRTQLDEAKETGSSHKDLKDNSRTSVYDFSKLLESNLAFPYASRRRKIFASKNDGNNNQIESKLQNMTLSHYFDDTTFLKKSNVINQKLNWTSCEEFSKRSVFHPDDIVNTEWLPFYIWSTRHFSSSIIHTYSYPTKKMVQYFKTTYGPYMKYLNWNKPKLFLKERREILLIAGDRRGLFHGVPKQELPSYIEDKNITLSVITLRMKIHDPYLAMMYCDDNYAVIMSELGTEPLTDQDKTLEANTLKFRGLGTPAKRDIETEMLLERLEKKKRIEAESRKIIPIEIPKIDLQVRY